MSKQRKITIAKAMAEAIAIEMRSDDNVLVMGEDIGALGGVFGNTRGLIEEFGESRIRDTPISETAFIGTAVGMAAAGMKPIVELMFVDFFGVCMDAIYNLAAKQSYFSGGNVNCPMVLMTSVGGGYGDAGQHSQTLFATFGHLPGLKVVIPADAHAAKGLMHAAIQDPNPVVFMYHKALQGMGWLGTVQESIVDVPEERFEVALDKAHVARAGTDITMVGLGHTVHIALQAAKALAAEGIEAEVVDLRCIAPLDRDTLIASAAKTGALLSVDDDYHSYGIGAEVVATVAEASAVSLKARPQRISYPDIPVPFAPEMEHAVLPNADKVIAAARQIVQEARA